MSFFIRYLVEDETDFGSLLILGKDNMNNPTYTTSHVPTTLHQLPIPLNDKTIVFCRWLYIQYSLYINYLLNKNFDFASPVNFYRYPAQKWRLTRTIVISIDDLGKESNNKLNHREYGIKVTMIFVRTISAGATT